MSKTKNKKDVLFLLQFFYPEYVSSATLPFDTALKLVEEGFTVDVLCGYPREYTEKVNVPRKETVNGVNIKRLKYLQLDRKKTFGRIVNYLSLTFVMFFHLFEMRKYKSIIVYTNPPILPFVAALASKIFSCKLVFVAYDLYPEIAIKTNVLTEKSFIVKLMNNINKFVYKQASAVVALSSEMKDYIVNNRNILANNVHVIPNWYKDEYVDNFNEKENVFSDVVSNRFVVGYFGNMGVAQDMEIIKEAIRYYKNNNNICFLLSGHGSEHEAIKEMFKNEDVRNAHLYEFLQGDDYLDALKISNCAIVSLKKGLTGLCVPSKTYGFMMRGLPIIAIMDESDIVRDTKEGAGYCITNNSAQDLIDLIYELENNNEKLIIKGKKSRQLYLQKYTPELCLKKYVVLLKNITQK